MNSYWEFGATSAIARYFCNKGFRGESGDQQRSCYVDPSDQVIKWLGSPLNCTGNLATSGELFEYNFKTASWVFETDVACEGFNLTNTTVEVSSYKFGSVAIFQCKPGYRAVAGNFVRTCSEYGTWSGEELKCECKSSRKNAFTLS